MHIQDIRQLKTPAISFEIFPPKTTEGHKLLNQAISQLAIWQPNFVSVTYGAGGGTRDTTMQIVADLVQNKKLNAIPHLTCIQQTADEIDSLLEKYAALGINNLLALRGDPPRNLINYDHKRDHFVQCADLVKHIKAFNASGLHPHTRGFGIGVAGFPEGHPSTPNRLLEMDYLKAKVDAGADYICTQLFFDNHDFHDFRERCELAGIRVPILAGILPVSTFTNLTKMANLAGGARIPARLLKAMLKVKDDTKASFEIGLHHATEQCAELLHTGVDGLHFYTLNSELMVHPILTRLGLSPKLSVSN